MRKGSWLADGRARGLAAFSVREVAAFSLRGLHVLNTAGFSEVYARARAPPRPLPPLLLVSLLTPSCVQCRRQLCCGAEASVSAGKVLSRPLLTLRASAHASRRFEAGVAAPYSITFEDVALTDSMPPPTSASYAGIYLNLFSTSTDPALASSRFVYRRLLFSNFSAAQRCSALIHRRARVHVPRCALTPGVQPHWLQCVQRILGHR
jgi:hypothetical protein